MRIRKAAPIIGAILVPILLFALAGSVVAGPLWPWSDIPDIQDEVIIAAMVGEKINYQGRLTDSGGNPLTGSYDMVFQLWDSESMTTQVGSDISVSGVAVADGLFNVKIPVTQSWFNGQALWLRVKVGADDWMTPLQEILPIPYALSLRPGAHIIGDIPFFGTILDVTNTGNGLAIRATSSDGPAVQGITQSTNMTGVAGINDSGGSGTGVYGYVATGNAIKGEGNDGVGVYGYSDNNYGVYASSDSTSLSAGYFESTNDKAIVARTSGADSSDWAGWFQATGGGAGIWSQSTNSYGIVARSTNDDGVYGQGGSGEYDYGGSFYGWGGIYGQGVSSYGGRFYSVDYRGLYASSPSNWYAGFFDNRGGSTEPGLYVNGTIAASGSKTGYVVDICLNEGPEPLETGDVVVVTGFSEPVNGEIPVIRARKATEAESTGVVGVVDQPFMVETSPDDGNSVPKPMAGTALIASGTAISPGEYLSVVTLGSFKAIKVDASYGAIRPGDLLVSSPNPGYAMKAAAPQPGTIIGKALGSLGSGTGTIPVLVTLQ